MPRTLQLRTYTIRPDALDAWLALWHTEIVPLRRAHGFEIGQAWVDRQRSQFVWLIGYAGEDGFEAANARYWNSPERERMPLQPEDYLVRSEVRDVEPA
ncbi:NIPSNAP family protein [Streptomyces sp. NPDC088354]|uniref:NIPSNAP family protein n=1 Tax=unclassified Streptomyces TaxID=2593676 RepID=UPI0029A5A09F|nr:NIPSNAP family protein [Streptomyces sp. MI02-7b]MDX3073493.1 NIPSNAP family protein [Streptomyces sp. MI02-7b]